MRILLVKTSSMGDIIHSLPALTDASRAYPDISFDWVVEENFAEIPRWHSCVAKVIPVALRRWRKKPWQSIASGEIHHFIKRLRQENYTHVVDAQSLIKSALLTRLSRGERVGLNWHSAWEPLASLAYQKRIAVDPKLHAVTRMRALLAGALDYTLPTAVADYGIAKERLPNSPYPQPYLVFLHATTWTTKHWPVEYWQQLLTITVREGFSVLLPWGNVKEQAQAQTIASENPQAIVLPKLDLTAMAGVIAKAKAVVTVDTGLGHLAAALNVPTISLYGPTDPLKTGTVGANQTHMAADFPCAPCLQSECTYQGKAEVFPACFATINPQRVWQQLATVL